MTSELYPNDATGYQAVFGRAWLAVMKADVARSADRHAREHGDPDMTAYRDQALADLRAGHRWLVTPAPSERVPCHRRRPTPQPTLYARVRPARQEANP